ncbi:hypothetical protein L1049_016618 [Liquidambar formosana]|uniref:Condensin-2 complex subunit H2 n=1 Tax=Liquidambar formosana TaxID=63359 RepID=A0AAP0S6Q3_LIQFO
MTNGGTEYQSGDSSSGGRFHAVQPLRDLESNWAVDLAKNLEEYLLKICSVSRINQRAHRSNLKKVVCMQFLMRKMISFGAWMMSQDALLASLAETEKQTELAARVSTWKQKIEHNLEEQDSRPPFDIHDYGERILDKLSLKVDNGNAMSFADVVGGQEKHHVARTFSALLQLVNNGDIDLDKGGADGESVCYTAVNPFYVRLLKHDKKQEEPHFRSSKKRAKSPMRRGCIKSDREKSVREKSPAVNPLSSGSTATMLSSQPNCKFSVKLGKIGGIRCTPEGKRRRRTRLVEPVDLHSAG